MGWSIAMMEKTGKMVLSIAGEAVGFAVIGACTTVSSAVPEAVSLSFIDPEQFELIWSAYQKNKKMLAAQAVALTDHQSNAFWPIYEAFQNDLKKIAWNTFNLIGMYSQKYGTLSNGDAAALLSEYLDLEAKRASLNKSYAKQLEGSLPSTALMRYFQIENKVEAALKYEFVRNIPLAK